MKKSLLRFIPGFHFLSLTHYAVEPTAAGNSSVSPKDDSAAPQPQGSSSSATPQPAAPAPSKPMIAKEEADRLVEGARQEEKAKLYEELNGLRSQKDLLETKTADLTKQLADAVAKLAEAENNYQALLEASQKDQGKTKVDIEKLITATTETAKKKVTEAYEGQITELRNRLDASEKAAHSMKIDNYRKEKIASANGQIIEEMVVGSTVEEINENFKKAMDTYRNVVAKAGVSNPTPPPTPPSPSAPSSPASMPSAPVDPVTPVNALESNIPRSGRNRLGSYAERRTQLLSELRKKYPTSNTQPTGRRAS